MDDYATRVWNRAAAAPDADSRAGFAPGDIVLADVLLLHGYAMNGGLLDAVESLTPEQCDAAIAGFEMLGLPEAGAVVADVLAEAGTDDPEALDRLEAEADRRYGEVVSSDSVIDERFQELLAERPELFASA